MFLVLDTSKSERLNEIEKLINNSLFKQAIQSLEEGIKEEERWEFHYLMGDMYSGIIQSNPYYSYEKAIYHYNKALRLNNEAVQVRINLGVFYYYNRSNQVDFKLAHKYLLEAYQRHHYHSGLVCWLLSKIYFLGLGVKKDFERAEKIAKTGWSLGHLPCLAMLGHCQVKRGKLFVGIKNVLKSFFLVRRQIKKDLNAPSLIGLKLS